MAHYELWIDGISSEQVGVVITSELKLSAPIPRVETFEIEGRNGALHVADGTFENRIATVTAYLYSDGDVKEKIAAVQDWLLNGTKRKIVHSEDLGHYIEGVITNGVEISTRLNKMQPFTIEFDCSPQRFINEQSADIEITASGQIVYNHTKYEAFPVYKLYRGAQIIETGFYTKVSVGANTVLFGGLAPSSVYIYDSEIGAIFSDGITVSERPYINFASERLSLKDGASVVEFSTEHFDKIIITPRWWEL